VNGRSLIAGFAADEARSGYRGSVFAPWPNRVAAGWYIWGWREHRLPLTEPDRGNALNGLACWLQWIPTASRDDSVSLTARLWPQTGYPFQLDLTVTYELDERGLTWRLEAYNSGTEAAPYGCSVHPYLSVGEESGGNCRLTVPAGRCLELDRARLLPTTQRSVEATSLDFRAERLIGDAQLNHAFTRVRPSQDGLARVALRSSERAGVAVEWDPRILPWVRIQTVDRVQPAAHPCGLAVEPMTCPPNALQTGRALIRLEPEAKHTAWWRIRAL